MDESTSWPQGHAANTVGAWIGYVFTFWAQCPCGWVGESCTTEEDADWDRLDHVTTFSAEADADQPVDVEIISTKLPVERALGSRGKADLAAEVLLVADLILRVVAGRR